MNTNKMTNEQISALADGELSDSRIDMTLASLRQPEGHAAWDVYHQIGDVLRSDDMAVTLSPDFATRMAARLEAEPAMIAPALSDPSGTFEKKLLNGRFFTRRAISRFAIPGAVAAAAATVALMTAPQLLVAIKGSPANANEPVVALAARPVSHVANVSSVAARVAAPSSSSAVAHDGTILRDPRIDAYLLAHQRFSPSVYSTAQFARSATFANDSNK